MRRPTWAQAVVAACAIMLGACGGSGGTAAALPGGANAGAVAGAAATNVPVGDWTRFNFDAARTGVGPTQTGITAHNLSSLRQRRVQLDGTVDSSPIELHAIRAGGRARDLILITTSYGRTIALDAGTGRRLWEFVPPDIRTYEGSSQITTTSPVADPGRRYVFAASPDGLIRKLSVSTGREIRSPHWPVHVTLDASHEKLASALNISGGELIATTGGYIGDAPPYQGHVVTIDRVSGRIIHVWNSLCSGQHRLLVPSRCPVSDSAIWARSGAVVEPGSGRLLVATGNATGSRPFDGVSNWSDSVLELSPDAARLLHNWTPSNQAALSAADADVGSTAPALLPPLGGLRLAVQGGKDGKLYLLDLDRLNGTSGAAGPRVGGQRDQVSSPGGGSVFSAPAVWENAGRVFVYVANADGTAVYVLSGASNPRLHLVAQNTNSGTSPIIAGGLLYVYDFNAGAVRVYEPTQLTPLISLPAATGHWNSPIVIAGRVIVPEGDANQHARHGTIDIYHLPGR